MDFLVTKRRNINRLKLVDYLLNSARINGKTEVLFKLTSGTFKFTCEEVKSDNELSN
jgi:hypothetical protein